MSLVIEVKVVPNSGRHECVLDKTGGLKCYLKSQPEQGKANQELIKLFSKALKISQGSIHIMMGATGRKKLVSINHDLTFDQVLFLLGIEKQLNIG